MPELREGRDYTIDPRTGNLVFTAEYHRRRGYCCRSRCRNCPWGYGKNDSGGEPKGGIEDKEKGGGTAPAETAPEENEV